MREKRWRLIALLVPLTAAMLACSLVGGTSTPIAPSAAAPTQGSSIPPQVTATVQPAGPTAAVTATLPPSGPTAVPPTVVPGSAIAHMGAGLSFDVGYVHMVDATHGWAIGGLAQAEDHAFTTQDGGQTWRDVTPPEPVPAAGTKLGATGYFSDASHGWVAFAPTQLGAVPPGIRV